MKLRNKKTGEIVEYDSVGFRKGQSNGWDDFIPNADSLAALNEVWEDYITAEPLIKDEKIRKAVRAWAEANNIDEVSHDACWNAFRCHDFVIGFDYDFDRHDGLKDGNAYAIAELCGEEEE